MLPQAVWCFEGEVPTRTIVTGDDDEINLLASKVQQVVCPDCGHLVAVADDAQPFDNIPCPSCLSDVCVPMQLDQFQLVGVLGRGTMGQVYQAVDQKLGRGVAVKLIRLGQNGAVDHPQSGLAEARALASLNHPNVTQVYEIGDKADHYYIVMELVDGGRLDQLITADQPMDEARVLEIGIDVALGLQAANRVGLVHGDVKPANILLDHQGVAKLVDFGLARFESSLDQIDKAYGTPQYVAPEVVLKQPVDHRADIFSLGATMYHALSGCLPYPGQTVEQVLRDRLTESPQDLRALRTRLHIQTADIIDQMMQIDPQLRYQSYDSLIEALREAFEAADPGPAQPNLDALDTVVRSAKPVRRRRVFKAKSNWRAVLLLVFLTLLMAGWFGGVLWWNAQHREAVRQAVLANQRPVDASGATLPPWANALQAVEPGRDAVAGDWSVQPDGLVVHASSAARLTVPIEVDDRYDVRVELARISGQGQVAVFLPVGFNQVMLVLSGNDGAASGLQWIDNEMIAANGTGVGSAALAEGEKHLFEIRVNTQGDQAQIEVDLNEQPYLRWSGPWASLDVLPPWVGLDPDSIGLGADQSQVVFHSVKVRRYHDPPEVDEADQPESVGPATGGWG